MAIAAEGSAFSAGGDLRQMRHLAASPAPAAHGWPGAIVELHHLALQAPKPLVALVDGPAYAGGFGLDLRFSKLLRFSGTRTSFNVDLFNSLNSSVVTVENANFAVFRQPTEVMMARFIRLGMQVDW